jgi:DNA mismatch endonuclease, patch repair protein
VTDLLSPEARSALMARVRRSGTAPELIVRSFVHRAGLRFRLAVRGLPGTPDIVLPKYRAVVFVHGCFWHRHEGCRYTTTPKANATFWLDKFARNVERDARKASELKAAGWRVYVVWACDTSPRTLSRLVAAIRRTG